MNDVQTPSESLRSRAFASDPVFLVTLAAGPVTWAALVFAGWPMPQGAPPAALLASSVLLYPPLEEWVFRGMLQGSLLRHPALARQHLGMSAANLLTSLVFAASHLMAHSASHAAAVLLPSLVFGFLRERFGSIVPGVLVHAFYNAGFVWLFATA